MMVCFRLNCVIYSPRNNSEKITITKSQKHLTRLLCNFAYLHIGDKIAVFVHCPMLLHSNKKGFVAYYLKYKTSTKVMMLCLSCMLGPASYDNTSDPKVFLFWSFKSLNVDDKCFWKFLVAGKSSLIFCICRRICHWSKY